MRQSEDPLITPAFIALTLSDAAYFVAAGALIGVTPFFVIGPLASGDAAVGLAVGVFSVTALVLRPLAGRWTDRYGRRPLLIGGACLFAVLVAGHLLVTSLAWLIVLRVLLGVAEALYFVAGYAALADLAPRGRAGEALSYNSLALYLGLAMGPVIGQALLGWGGFTLLWVGTFLVVVVAAVLATRVPETRESVDSRLPSVPLIHPSAVIPGVALFTGIAAISGFFAFAGLHARDLGFDAWSVVLFVFGIVVITCRIVFAKLPDRVRPLRLVGVALSAVAVGLIIAASVSTVWGVLLGAAVMAVGTAFLTPAVFATIFTTVPASERGSAAGTASAFIDVGLGGGPMFLGFVAAVGGIPAAFFAAAALIVVGLAFVAFRPVPPVSRHPDPALD